MTVSELIALLQRYPGAKPVRILMANVPIDEELSNDVVEVEDWPRQTVIVMRDAYAQEADVVRNEGPYVSIRGK